MTDHLWLPDEVFVFGSNLHGIHGAGAAAFARRWCGARLGVGEGRTGQSYALPTCRAPGDPLTIDHIGCFARRFIEYAITHMETKFFLTRVGCGLAGFRDSEIAPLFAKVPSNVRTPPEWDPYLKEGK